MVTRQSVPFTMSVSENSSIVEPLMAVEQSLLVYRKEVPIGRQDSTWSYFCSDNSNVRVSKLY